MGFLGIETEDLCIICGKKVGYTGFDCLDGQFCWTCYDQINKLCLNKSWERMTSAQIRKVVEDGVFYDHGELQGGDISEVTFDSLYICVKDMDRAISFYENLFGMKVSVKDDIYSVFELGSFRFGLFAFEKKGEEHSFGSSCVPSFTFADKAALMEKIDSMDLDFPLTKINKNWVCEITDTEGNRIELTARATSS